MLLLVLGVVAGACLPATDTSPVALDRSADGAVPVPDPSPVSEVACAAAADVRLDARLLHTLPPGALPSELGPEGAGALRVLRIDPDDIAALVGVIAAPRDGARCAEGIVTADLDDAVGRTLAAATAIARGLPLLLADADVSSIPEQVRALLIPPPSDGLSDPSRRSQFVLVGVDDLLAQADVVAGANAGWTPVLIGPGEVEELVDELLVTAQRRGIRWAASSVAHARALEEVRAALAVAGVEVDRYEAVLASQPIREVWLGDVRAPQAALMAAATAALRGAAFVPVDGSELRSGSGRTSRIRDAVALLPSGGRIVIVGDPSDEAVWQLETILTGTPLPGGGFLPLEDRRIVALYGSPDATGLGLLGEQDDEATVNRAEEFAGRYGDATDGRSVVPGLNVIATIASSAAEPTGDYSRRVPIERLRPLVELAGDRGLAVLLDLQPGRTSFLEQARELEELLVLPHVHLALDPEWRIGPDERHLVRIGSVEAAEVQEVVDWLAALVRRERLPQKVLMLHQFTLAMLPDRDSILIPPELVGVIHMDGQGRLATKDRTYAALTAGAAQHWGWGWKNFTRIDAPVASPERTLDRLPVPVIITYQ